MFGWQKGRKPAAILHFKDSRSAFEMECKYGSARVSSGSVHLAIVLQADGRSSDVNPATPGAHFDANQLVLISVADAAGEFAAMAKTLNPLNPPLRKGDLVIWKAASRIEAASAISGDPRSAWLGFIVQRALPSYDPKKGWLTARG